MNALDLLKKQHKETNELFAKLGEENRTLEQDLVDAIEHHSFVEEMFFYPVLATKEETKDLVKHALEEHARVKVLIHEWELSKDDNWKRLAEEIKTNVQHHINEEETEMFPKVQQAFSKEELDRLGRQMLF